MASNIPSDASSQHHLIVYCPSCGASASLPIVPPSNAGLFCDICTFPNLLVSTNDGADWNPLSDAFNALSLSSSQHGDGGAETSAPAATTAPQIIQHPVEDLEVESPIPTIQDEMKRRSLILSELMNFREALYQHQETPNTNTNTNTQLENNMEVTPTDHFSNIARTYNDLLHLRRQSGVFLMDEVDTMADGAGVYMHNNLYPNGIYPQQAEEEGMYDDPPQDYVNSHPPVQEVEQGWYGVNPGEEQVQKEEFGAHLQPIDISTFPDDDDDDDDEGQVYATPEQRDEMKRRRSELHQDKELKAREMFWRKYGIGGLGTGH